MTSVDGVATASSTETRSSKKIKSRLSSLFNSKTSHLSEPQIELDEPWREYTRGEAVKGKIVLQVAKPLGITHLTVSLFGYLEVFKHHSRNQPDLRANPVRVASGKGKRWVTEYYGDGFASLFEQNATLCGEGRLDPQTYHFQFELPFPPDRDLPTSIKFERGTIVYGIAATVTRPTTIAPTITAARSVKYRQTIDVAKLRAPKPRVVTLEPVSMRASMVRRLTSTSINEERSGSRMSDKSKVDSTRRPQPSTATTTDSGARSPTSPAPSVPSTMSVSSTGQQEPESPASPRLSQGSHEAASTSQTSAGKRVITASIELSKAGVMPGDTLPLQIHIQHTKRIRSVSGVIVTFYRQARVDMHPNLPSASDRAADSKERRQNYYPMSKSGIGGLSLSAAGSSQVWRKDLSQSISPLYVDDQTMTAIVRPTVHIPEDIFPTMSNAPGDMIMFKYYVEVMIDIHGKWPAGSNVPNVGSHASISTPSNTLDSRIDGGRSPAPPINGLNQFYYPAVSKGAIKLQCEVIIGNQDSGKGKGKARQNSAEPSSAAPAAGIHDAQTAENPAEGAPYDYADEYDPNYYEPRYYDSRYYDYYNGQYYDHNDPYLQQQEPPVAYAQMYPPVPPPPDMPDDSQLSEKERMRRAEQTLLPSRPPGADEAQASAGDVPSAPFLPGEGYHPSSIHAHDGRHAESHAPLTSSSTNSTITPRGRNNSIFSARSSDHPAPAYSATAPEHPSSIAALGQGPRAATTDDKQELERHRLNQEATAINSEMQAGEPSQFVASAPSPSAVEDGANSNAEVSGIGPSAPLAEEVGLSEDHHAQSSDLAHVLDTPHQNQPAQETLPHR